MTATAENAPDGGTADRVGASETGTGAASRPEPLIGAVDVETPSWLTGFESVAKAGPLAVARSAPGTVALAVRWSWATSPRLTLLAGMLQLAAGAVTAFGLLATADVFTQLLAQGPDPGTGAGRAAGLALVVAAAAAHGLLDAAGRGAGPRWSRGSAAGRGHAARRGDRRGAGRLRRRGLRRAGRAGRHPRSASGCRQVLRTSGDLIAWPDLGVRRGGHRGPAAPRCWARSCCWPRCRRAGPGPVAPADVRLDRAHRSPRRSAALGDQRPDHRPGPGRRGARVHQPGRAARRAPADRRRAHRRRRSGCDGTGRCTLAGRTLSGIGSAAGYVVLALLLYAGVLPLALAGTAVVAMRAASTSIVTAVYGLSTALRVQLLIDLYRTCLADVRARRRAPATATLPGDPAEIELHRVGFRYPGKHEPAVHDVTLRCAARRGDRPGRGERLGQDHAGQAAHRAVPADQRQVRWDGVDTAASSPRSCTVAPRSCCRTPCTGR